MNTNTDKAKYKISHMSSTKKQHSIQHSPHLVHLMTTDASDNLSLYVTCFSCLQGINTYYERHTINANLPTGYICKAQCDGY